MHFTLSTAANSGQASNTIPVQIQLITMHIPPLLNNMLVQAANVLVFFTNYRPILKRKLQVQVGHPAVEK